MLIRFRHQLKRMSVRLRASKYLHANNDPLAHFRVFNSMASIELIAEGSHHRNDVNNSEYELCLRQKIIQLLLTNNFLGELAIGAAFPATPIIAFVPKLWRQYLISRNISLHALGSMFGWILIILKAYILGLIRSVRLMQHAWRSMDRDALGLDEVILPNLLHGNIPSSHSATGFRKDFVSWVADRERGMIYAHLPGSNVKQVDKRIRIVGEIFPPLNKLGSRFVYVLEVTKLIISTSTRLLFGFWQSAIMLVDEVEIRYAKHLCFTRSQHYIFCSSGFEHRPLWTYLAESKGSKITYAFYSTNSEVISFQPNYKHPEPPGYQTISWGSIMVWDSYHKNFLKSVMKLDAKFEVVGSNDFTDEDSQIPASPSGVLTCAVFDVSAFQPLVAAWKGILDPYYTVNTVNSFLEDVSEALAAEGIIMRYKRKRSFMRIAATAYRNNVNKIISQPGIVLINPGVSARRLIGQSDLVISMPYTSTCNIGSAENKPSIFYDPSGKLPHDANLAHGLTVIRGKLELRKWLASMTTTFRKI